MATNNAGNRQGIALNPAEVKVYIHAYMDRLAAVLGHDLRIAARDVKCRVVLSDGKLIALEATIDAWHVAVECALAGAREDRNALNPEQRAAINTVIHDQILHAEAHPLITFSSTRVEPRQETLDLYGKLDLHGHKHPLHFRLLRSGDHFEGATVLQLGDYGIAPFTKWMGLYRSRPEVTVQISLPVDMGPHDYGAGVKPV